jgi:bifunctional DNase/RNase
MGMQILEDDGVGPASLTEMRVCRLDHAPEASVLVLESAGASSSLTIALPTSDASALMRARTAPDMDCSDTCDVVLAPTRRLEAAVSHAIIDGGPDGIRAELTLTHGAAPFTLACHVVDALTLALRAQAPIYATRRALDRAVVNGHRASAGGTTSPESMRRRP